MVSEPALDIQNLRIRFRTATSVVEAVSGVNLMLSQGEILGLVGESGCGKSSLAHAVMRLHDERLTRMEGSIRVGGQEVLSMSPRALQKLRGREVAMVFQDPLNTLNPVLTIGAQLIEAIRDNPRRAQPGEREKAVELLKATGITSPERRLSQYPYEMSGGMRQRVVIAIALARNPALLIADEPTTALDVTIQAEILDLIKHLTAQRQMTTLFITHDLGVISHMADRVAVMYLGEIVEEASTAELFGNPLHPYTRRLLRAAPSMTTPKDRRLLTVPGRVPSLTDIPSGCRFANRCSFAQAHCRQETPQLTIHAGGHAVRCWRKDEIAAGTLRESELETETTGSSR